jgi:hypothetical protein
MKDDPYSALSGLDQQLFKDASKLTTQQADKPASLPADKETSQEAVQPADKEVSQPTDTEPGKQGNHQRNKEPNNAATLEANRPPVAPLRGPIAPSRNNERHTYDIYQDQARWMNRIKLDIEELYSADITVNSVVALAIDLIRIDFEENGERSQIMRVLVRGQRLRRANKNGTQ